MNTTNPAPGGTGQSPTGYAWLPQWLVKTLLVLALVATAWQAAELYDFEAGAWHPERAPAFILALVATAGVASQGIRRGATMAIALALGLTLTSTSALASTSTVLNPRSIAGVPSVGDILDLVPGAGVTCRAGSCALAPHLWGSVALVDVAPGWTLGPVLGGAAILDGTGVTGAVSLGAGLQLPWGTSVRLGLLVTADYYLPAALPAGWGMSGSLGFFF